MNRRVLLAAMAAAIASRWQAAVAEWPFPRVRPSTSNRDASLELLWRGVARYGADAAERLDQARRTEEYIFREGAGAVSVLCRQKHYIYMMLAVDALWQRKPEASQLLGHAFSHLYWAAEIAQHFLLQQRNQKGAALYGRGDPLYLDRFWLHGLAAAGGAPEVADWAMPYMFNVFRATGGTGGILELRADVPFQRFFRYLSEAQVRHAWPSRIDRRSMRGYGSLMANVQDPSAFRVALVEFCDYRVMQALGYDSMDAPAPRPGDRDGSVLDAAWWPKVYPLELFSLRHVYKATTGRTLSLEAEHPLLKTPLMSVPALLLPLQEDEFISRVRALAQQVFGTAWKPLTPVPPI